MGANMSLFDNAVGSMAFKPPHCTYDKKKTHIVRTVDGDDICMQLTTPFSVINRDETSTIQAYKGPGMCILMSHGNAEDIADIRSFAQAMADRFGVDVVTYDYVNFGHSSTGVTTELNMHRAIETVHDYMTRKMNVPEQKIILMGRSIGSAPTVYLGSRAWCQCRGIVLVSPLASGIRTFLKPSTIGERLCSTLDTLFCPNIKYITEVKVPVCIIHGRKDTVIPIHNSVELYDAITTEYHFSPLYIDTAGHNDIVTQHTEELFGHIERFLRHCEKNGSTMEEYPIEDDYLGDLSDM